MTRAAAVAVSAERKRDAREKIELGGLIVKAGLREEDRAVLYGGLIELARLLDDPNERARLKGLGYRTWDDAGDRDEGAA